MRICADCSNPIRRHDKWQIDGSRIRHVCCSNPRMINGRLPLNFTALLPVVDDLSPEPATLRERFDHCVGLMDDAFGTFPVFQQPAGK